MLAVVASSPPEQAASRCAAANAAAASSLVVIVFPLKRVPTRAAIRLSTGDGVNRGGRGWTRPRRPA